MRGEFFRKKNPTQKIRIKIQYRIWEFRGQNPHCKDLPLKTVVFQEFWGLGGAITAFLGVFSLPCRDSKDKTRGQKRKDFLNDYVARVHSSHLMC